MIQRTRGHNAGQMARKKKFVYAVTEDLPHEKLLEPPAFGGHFDPHVWFDVPLWSQCIEKVVEGLSEYDTAGKSTYEKNAAQFKKKLGELHQWALKKAQELNSLSCKPSIPAAKPWKRCTAGAQRP